MKPTKVRWEVITLLFFATTINYLDRTNLSVALPVIAKQLNWTPAAMGAISSAFLLTYALLQMPIGVFIDKIGTRMTYIWSVIIWSLASMATALGTSFGSIYFFRLILGVGEAPAFPAATKTAADWIPRRQRGIATGFFTAGVNMGSAIALPLVAWIVSSFGWQMSFIITGSLGFIWLLFWLVLYRDRKDNKRVNAAENALIDADITTLQEQPRVPWIQLFKKMSTWGLMLGYSCQLYIMFVFVTWLPTYLVQARHMTLLHSGIYGMMPFIAGTISAFLGGRTSDLWVRKTPNGRKIAMSLGLILAMTIIPAVYANSAFTALILLTISEFGVMFSNGAAWAAASEIAPAGQAASVASIQNFGGNVGGFLAPTITGILVQATHSFNSALILAGILAFVGAIIYYTMLPGSKVQEESKTLAV
ncbi:sugar phosphate permease [Desulfosporosinus acidiphilus SJ4]|uniref:Sugar phosphate permease n=1 Tax=Desulfosporosinus acidiphilus (strain DSM 22704 / JCM 16185 / SJ4) TaxID=646529 RepID=I4D8G5_DESAJ|nr:MFS transporter [Desulfosporosinus acidiphilus]AFM42089.1 sugar phosphate permease [Desulfosporosinus acidiphilus SJ4]